MTVYVHGQPVDERNKKIKSKKVKKPSSILSKIWKRIKE